MMSRRSTKIVGGWLVLVLGLLPLGGCNLVKAFTLLTAPTTEKVPAEYSHLTGQRVLVYVWIPTEIAWDYPKIRLDLSASLANHLHRNVEDVTMVDPIRVEAHLEKSKLSQPDVTELGRQFRADHVVQVTVYKFSMRDPGLAHYYRGRVGASVTVHDLREADGGSEPFPLGEVVVAVPEESEQPIGYGNIRPDVLRQETYRVFTVELGKKFHVYERPVG